MSFLTHLLTLSNSFTNLKTDTFLIILLVSIILFELVICILLFMYNRKSNHKIKDMKASNEILNNTNDSLRAFKHDFHNILQVIGGCIESEDFKSLKEYYRDLLCDCYSSFNLEKLASYNINNAPLKSILASKYYKADSKNIPMNFDIETNLDNLNITNYELTRMLGILLDNSIEAAEECKDKLINVKFYDDTKSKRNLIIIENTYSDKNVDTVKIFEKDYTTKKNNTGLGLWEVNRILNKHNNLSLFTTKSNELFVQQLEIYKK